MGCIPTKTTSQLSLLHGRSERRDTCSGESTLDKAWDAVELYVKKKQKIKQSEGVSVEKTQRSKSFNSWRSNTSPRVLYQRATTIASRENSGASSEDGEQSLEVSVKMTQRSKSINSLTSNTSFLYDRATMITSRENSGASSEGGYGKRFSWLAPLSDSSDTTDSFTVSRMTKVHPNLYIGNEEDSNDADLLNRNGITHILSLIGHKSSVGKVEQIQYPMHDLGRSDIKDVLDEVYEFMESGQNENNNLLVHCKLGQNRSAVVVIAFLMKKFKKTLHRAHRDLRKVRPIIQVNVDYAKQLLELERDYFGKNSLPPDWMEREYNEAAIDVIYKYEDLTTLRQSLMFSDVDSEQNS